MDSHKNARLTPKGREEMVRAVADRGMLAGSFNPGPGDAQHVDVFDYGNLFAGMPAPRPRRCQDNAPERHPL